MTMSNTTYVPLLQHRQSFAVARFTSLHQSLTQLECVGFLDYIQFYYIAGIYCRAALIDNEQKIIL